MGMAAATSSMAEAGFAALVDACGPDEAARGVLIGLLREDHPVYEQRGAAAVVRMRGWVLAALARTGVSPDALIFVLEELDTGSDPYLVAAAARALRHSGGPSPAFAPFLMRAFANIRYHDDPVSFESYGEYATSTTATTPLRELLKTLAWLGPQAASVLGELRRLAGPDGGLPKKLLPEVCRTMQAIGGTGESGVRDSGACCGLPDGLGKVFLRVPGLRGRSEPVGSVVFEDHMGTQVRFGDFFRGRPSIVAFFYTRCDNPLKCSLTITKLGRIQRLLEERGLDGEIRTAAITYDPGFDLPVRIQRYGEMRGMRLDSDHRMLRATGGLEALRRHFKLGVNFIESLVNRHRIELFILDSEGRIAVTFERIHWDEEEVVDRATEVRSEARNEPSSVRHSRLPVLGTLASLAVAFFPKCPVCWMAYLSMFGIAGLAPYASVLEPILIALMLVNLASVWIRGRAVGRLTGPYLVSAAAVAIVASRIGPGWQGAAILGAALSLAGSLWSVMEFKRGYFNS